MKLIEDKSLLIVCQHISIHYKNINDIYHLKIQCKTCDKEFGFLHLDDDIEGEALASMAEITSKLAIKVRADITELFRLVHDISGILVTQQKQIDEIKNK